jgi:competence protein ComEA
MNLKQLREFFIFTRGERNGIMVLLLILTVAIILNIILPYIFPVKRFDTTAWNEEADKYYAKIPPKEKPERPKIEGTFDPNAPTSSELIKFGIPAGLAARWVKYIEKGGHFKSKEEVMKLYGMNDILYLEVEGHLKMQKTNFPGKSKPEFNKKSERMFPAAYRKDTLRSSRFIIQKNDVIIELNKADSTQLEALPGIGPVLASRIIKYRKLLGGFYEVNQLKEIYGMSDELWLKFSPHLIADPSGIRKININFLSLVELGKHPYIGFRQAKKIIKRRDLSGKIKGNDELAIIFTPDSLEHLRPYLLTGEENP